MGKITIAGILMSLSISLYAGDYSSMEGKWAESAKNDNDGSISVNGGPRRGFDLKILVVARGNQACVIRNDYGLLNDLGTSRLSLGSIENGRALVTEVRILEVGPYVTEARPAQAPFELFLGDTQLVVRAVQKNATEKSNPRVLGRMPERDATFSSRHQEICEKTLSM